MRNVRAAVLAALFILGAALGAGCSKNAKESGGTAGAGPSSPASSTVPAYKPVAKTSATVTEYLDLFESYSQKYYLDIHLKLAEKYGGQLKFDLKPVVAKVDAADKKRSREAAASALCAGQQGKMQDFLTVWFKDKFMNLKPSDLTDAAEQVKLNLPIFDVCVKKTDWDSRLSANLNDARTAGVFSVPTVFLEDMKLSGVHNLADYEGLLDEEFGAPPGAYKGLVMTVLYDDTCKVCDDRPSANMILTAFRLQGAVVKRVAASSPQGQALVNLTHTPFLPRILFNPAIESAPAFPGLKDEMDPLGDAYLYKQQGSGSITRWVTPPKIPEPHVIGSATAPLTVYEFLDFQCPACGGFYALKEPELRDKYVRTGLVKWVALQYPLQMHENAYRAAVASECASDQGKFWEYHNVLFENQSRLTQNDLIQYASRVPGIKVEAFTNCLSRADVSHRVDQNKQLAISLGCPGTPTFFIGNYSMGNLELADFERVIDSELARLKGKT